MLPLFKCRSISQIEMSGLFPRLRLHVVLKKQVMNGQDMDADSASLARPMRRFLERFLCVDVLLRCQPLDLPYRQTQPLGGTAGLELSFRDGLDDA
jgi:hypothetical protein